jgi:[acyl-carrier-protein] S-malonyltransferase
MLAARAFLFPGQGAQHLGMAVDVVDAYPEARAVFAAGSEILGRDLLRVCREGPEEELNSTRVSQPAIFLHSLAMLEVLGKQAASPDNRPGARFGRDLPAVAAAGLSLGEYSALVFAGSIEFEDALRIVGARAEYMQEACDQTRGTMASVIGLAAEKVEEVVEKARADGLRAGIANYNSAEQTVVSGEAEAVDELLKRLEAAGARRAIRLKVAGAYHSSLMASATGKLEPFLARVAIREPRVPFYSNVAGRQVRDPEEIRQGLIRQVESPVRWSDIIRRLLEAGLPGAIEVGPGRVLQGLLRSARRDAACVSFGTVKDAEGLRSEEVPAA